MKLWLGCRFQPDQLVAFTLTGIGFSYVIRPKQRCYLCGACIKSWADSARKLKRFDVEIVVPGHGPWGGPEFIDQTIATAQAANEKNK